MFASSLSNNLPTIPSLPLEFAVVPLSLDNAKELEFGKGEFGCSEFSEHEVEIRRKIIERASTENIFFIRTPGWV
jgi:hypothetical protein